ncbi:integrase catalytic domain-containing protein [Trichonephila clavipes]|nr:integrase catalytic domain-containing protein [Trichonephila clavipes]
MDLKTFVQNRVAKIQELCPNQLWRHVPSDQNPTDLVSRGVDPDKLLQQNLWFIGPTFLSAVHIELVLDLTSQAFIPALKRFMARRGKCAKLFSDNGKNFVGACNEIKKLLEIVRNPDEKLANYLAAEGIEWKFIPARSPNFGGLWEAAIKSCKYHLKRVGINLTYEELLTVTVQIEGILNSRPLCPLSNNDDDFQVLTPTHFLINRSLNSLEEPNLTKCKESNLKRWQKITKIVQLMWKFWSCNYLNQLLQRGKWMFEKNNVKIGDLVLIIEENLPTYKWALGRIVELYYGEDKKVRVVKIKTQYSTCKRAISKIFVLPMEDP